MKYREIDRENQSSLKKILDSPQAYLKSKKPRDESKTPEHFIFGDILDMMICGEKDEFDEKYLVVKDEIKCSDSIKEVIETFFDRTKDFLIPITSHPVRELLLTICESQGYGQSWKEDTVIAKLEKEGGPYYKFLCDTVGKIPVSDSEYAKVVNCLASLKASEFTAPYMKRIKGQEFFDKLVVQFEYAGVEMKGELDRVIIDHNVKTVQPIDFKSTGKSNYGFQYDFWKFRYDFQAGTYYYGLRVQPDIKALVDKGYTLLPFLYIVAEKESINSPFVFEITDDVLRIGLYGGTRSNGKVMEGLAHAIERLKWHTKNDKWDYPKEHEIDGKLKIEI